MCGGRRPVVAPVVVARAAVERPERVRFGEKTRERLERADALSHRVLGAEREVLAIDLLRQRPAASCVAQDAALDEVFAPHPSTRAGCRGRFRDDLRQDAEVRHRSEHRRQQLFGLLARERLQLDFVQCSAKTRTASDAPSSALSTTIMRLRSSCAASAAKSDADRSSHRCMSSTAIKTRRRSLTCRNQRRNASTKSVARSGLSLKRWSRGCSD